MKSLIKKKKNSQAHYLWITDHEVSVDFVSVDFVSDFDTGKKVRCKNEPSYEVKMDSLFEVYYYFSLVLLTLKINEIQHFKCVLISCFR